MTRSAELQDIEPDDFTRYLEYAYRHDYTVPSWKQEDSTVEKNTSSPAVENDDPPAPEVMPPDVEVEVEATEAEQAIWDQFRTSGAQTEEVIREDD